MIPPGLRIAIRHLTVVSVPWHTAEARTLPASALPWFPVVGLAIGAAVAGVLAVPGPALPRAAIALAMWTALTGGVHEDAWMDSADAGFAVAERERRLEILKDPHAGAHAVSALVLVMLLRFSALTLVSWAAPLLAAMCGRWMMALTLANVPAARPDGLGAAFARGARAGPASVAGVVIVIALTFTSGTRVAFAGACALASGIATAIWLTKRFGGLTGDGHGAAGYAAETIALLAMVPTS
jgi:cobalamin 5'-phosphate synthase/cobalamin synthase